MGHKIPNLVHFVYGLLPHQPFQVRHYLAIKSAHDVYRPDQIRFYYQHPPEGEWWDRARPLLHLVHVTPPSHIFGIPLLHYAHQSDIVRLEALLQHGGLYFDIDTIVLRPLTEALDSSCVMAKQGTRGLCNAVIAAEPQAPFLQHWYQMYHHFRSRGQDEHWDESSVIWPLQLSEQPHLRPFINIFDSNAFFFPLWDNMEILFTSRDADLFQTSYSIHLWESKTSAEWLDKITLDYIYRYESNFTMMARRILTT
ncbi:MAG TPA: glycosyltransferase [Dehalococcoidia bacterium]|nr:glycosyltransferase [Dehalococcoidia bacterium]